MDIHGDVAAYVLDALSRDHRDSFEAHLDTCPSCRDEVAQLAGVTAHLSHLTTVAPPPALRASVLEAVRAEPVSGVREATPGPRPRGRTAPATPRWLGWAAAASVLAAAVLGAGLWGEKQRSDEVQAQTVAAQNELSRLRDLTSAPDARLRRLDLTGGGSATVIVSRGRGQGVVIEKQLPAPGAGQTYQLWTMSGGKPTPSVVFDPRSGQQTWFAANLRGVTGLAMTIEPAGGSAQPTGPILASTTVAF